MALRFSDRVAYCITPVAPDLVPAAMHLVRRVVAEMHSQGIYQWDEIYPDQATLEQDAAAGTLFGLFSGSDLLGIVVLNQEEDPEYRKISWQHQAPLVVHRLAVDPAWQGRGLARQLMAFAESHALAQGCRSIRLDTFGGNFLALNLYRKLGFTERGWVKLRKGDFMCFEKAVLL